METGLWLLGLGLPLWIGAGFFAPKPPHSGTAFHMLSFFIGGAMSFFGWTMTVLATSRNWELHPVIGVLLWFGGFGLAAFALHLLDERHKRRTARG